MSHGKGSLNVNNDDDDDDNDNYSLNTLAFFHIQLDLSLAQIVSSDTTFISQDFVCRPEKATVVIINKKEVFGQILIDNQSKAGGLGLESDQTPRETRSLGSEAVEITQQEQSECCHHGQ